MSIVAPKAIQVPGDGLWPITVLTVCPAAVGATFASTPQVYPTAIIAALAASLFIPIRFGQGTQGGPNLMQPGTVTGAIVLPSFPTTPPRIGSTSTQKLQSPTYFSLLISIVNNVPDAPG